MLRLSSSSSKHVRRWWPRTIHSSNRLLISLSLSLHNLRVELPMWSLRSMFLWPRPGSGTALAKKKRLSILWMTRKQPKRLRVLTPHSSKSSLDMLSKRLLDAVKEEMQLTKVRSFSYLYLNMQTLLASTKLKCRLKQKQTQVVAKQATRMQSTSKRLKN